MSHHLYLNPFKHSVLCTPNQLATGILEALLGLLSIYSIVVSEAIEKVKWVE